jgi:hypothetical protein
MIGPNHWFRFYVEVLDDPKVQRLSGEVFKTWVNLLCFAATSNGVLPDNESIAFRLRLPIRVVEKRIELLIREGLLDALVDEDGDASPRLEPHNWRERQFISDTSLERVRKYRDNRRKLGLPVAASYRASWANLVERDGERCAYCGSDARLCVDHMIPTAQGGDDNVENLCIACKSCNSGKAGRTPEQAGLSFTSATAFASYKHYLENFKRRAL